MQFIGSNNTYNFTITIILSLNDIHNTSRLQSPALSIA